MADAELTTVARPYARAVFRTAVDQGRLADWSRSLAVLSAIAGDARVRASLENPDLSHNQRARLLVDLGGDALDAGARNLVTLLAEYQRIPLLPEIARLFEALRTEYEKTVEVELVSAFEVSTDDSQRLADILKQKLQRDVRIQARVDATLVGGVIVRTGDSVIDGSVRGKLARLTQVLNS